MKREAFTMIELIFVIVILGSLAAVALPKFQGISKQAHHTKLKAFVGTLNRTTGPTVWAESISVKGFDKNPPGQVASRGGCKRIYEDMPPLKGMKEAYTGGGGARNSTCSYRPTSKGSPFDGYIVVMSHKGSVNTAPVWEIRKGS